MSEDKTISHRKKTEAAPADKPKAVKKPTTRATTKAKTDSPAEPKTRAKAAVKKTEPKVGMKADDSTVKKTAAKSKTAPKTAVKPETKAKAAEKKTAVKAEPKVKATAKPKAAAKPKAEVKAKAAAKPKKPAKPTGSELAELVAAAAAEHKPIDPVLLDLSGRSSVADWFFVASADNPRQMEAIAEKIIRRARERGVRPLGQEGMGRGASSPWVLVDLGDVVVHIFNLEARSMYDLEGLWTDAPRHPVET